MTSTGRGIRRSLRPVMPDATAATTDGATSSGPRTRRAPARRPIGHRMRTLLASAASVLAVSCASSDGPAPLADDDYVVAMSDICTSTDERLDGLPAPPEQIRPADWATEVARVYRAESAAAEALVVDGSIRETHRAFVTTTDGIADAFTSLSEVLSSDPDAMTEASEEVTRLSLGRDDLAGELGLDSCRRATR